MTSNVTDTLRKELGEALQVGAPLNVVSTMKVGGEAEYFIVARTVEQLIQSIRAARQVKIPWRVIGNASNMLVSDKGVPGMVIQNRTSDVSFVSDSTEALVASGVPLARLIIEAAKRGLAGLEPLYGIPATVGGALYGNAGAHGAQISQYVRELTLYKPDQDKVVRVPVRWLHAEYRTTRLKQSRAEGDVNQPIVLMAKFVFMRQKSDTILAKIRKYDDWRKSHQPIGTANCGSVFRNAGTGAEETAGYLLDQAGAKDVHHGQAHVSKQHANFLINDGRATANDVQYVIDEMKRRVRDHSGVELKEEIEYLGDWTQTNLEDVHE